MNRKEDLEFKKWKKSHKLDESSFLDGEEEPVQTVDKTPSEEKPSEEEADISLEEPAEDIDISEEPSEEEGEKDDSLEIDDTAAEETSDDKGSTEDFAGDDTDKEDDGTKDESGSMTELKDILSTLTTAVQSLTDKIDNISNKEEEAPAESEPAAEPAAEDTGDTESFDDFAAEEGGEEGGESAEGGEEGSSEGGEEGGEGSSEGGEEGGESTEEAPAEEEDDTPDDTTKSEAWNKFHKKGKILSEKSDYLVGKLLNSRYDMLEEPIMTIVRAKIRQKIEAEKQAIKAEALKK